MVKTHEDLSGGPGVHQLLLGIDLSFLKLVCSTKGFPGKGRSFLGPLKAVWGKTQPGSAAASYNSQLSCQNSLYILFDVGKLLN